MTIDKPILPPEFFHVRNGPDLPTLVALRAFLRRASKEQFAHHVNARRNDFATWIDDIFGEHDLAVAIRACATRDEMVKVLNATFAKHVSKRHPAAVTSPVVAVQKTVREKETAVTQPSGGTDAAVPTEKSPQKSSARQHPKDDALSGAPPDARSSARDPAQEALDDAQDKTLLDRHIGDWDDESFAPVRTEMSRANERLSDQFDAISKRLRGMLDDPLPKTVEGRIEKLSARYNDVQGRISEERKRGVDMLFPSMLLRRFPSKLALAKATRQEIDFAIAAQILDETGAAIRDEAAAAGNTVREQVMRMAGMPEEALKN